MRRLDSSVTNRAGILRPLASQSLEGAANSTVLVILCVLSTCQAHFHGALRSGRLRGSHLALITHDLVRIRELRGFALLFWRDLGLEALH